MTNFLTNAAGIIESSTGILKRDNDAALAVRAHCGAYIRRDRPGVKMQNHVWNCLTCQKAVDRENALSLAESDVGEAVSRSGSQVVHTLVGPADAVRLVAQRIFDEFPPAGYGTRATIFPDRTVIVRARSCD